MLNKNKFNLVSFFFPPFSEIDLVSMFYLLFLTGIHHRESLISLGLESSNMFLIMVLSIPIGLLVFYNAVSYSQISKEEKGIFAFSFYLFLSLVSMYALVYPHLVSNSNYGSTLLKELEFIILAYLFLKSISRLILMRFAYKLVAEDMTNQMNNKQIVPMELILIILFAPVLYLLVQEGNSIAQTLSLSFFYLTTLNNLVSELISRFSTSK